MKKNVVILTTAFQCEIFNSVLKKEEIPNLLIIYCSQLNINSWPLLKKCNNKSTLCLPKEYLTFKRARSLIKQAKTLHKDLDLEPTDTLWFANDADPFTQALYKNVGFKETRVLEDGLGAYVQPSFLAWRGGLISLLRRLKLILYLFPYYRAFYSICGNIKADFGYSYNKMAYPKIYNIKLITIEKQTIEQKVKNPAADKDIVFIGQPFIEKRRICRQKYLEHILFVKKKYANEKNKLIYRPHPGESTDTLSYLESNGIIVNYESGISAEEYIYSSGNNLIIAGIASTSLIYVRNMENVEKVISTRIPNVRGLELHYTALARLGVEVIPPLSH